MHIGLHVSAAGGVENTVARAKELGCETFQFFSRPPQGGKPPKLTRAIVSAFITACKSAGLTDPLIHTPYFINLASAHTRIRHRSIAIIREELQRATLLGVPFVVTHIGSSKDVARAQAMLWVKKGLREILKGYAGDALLLLENSAGAGNVIGDTFEEIAQLLTAYKASGRIGACLDTCHAFASGYDVRTAATVAKTIATFDSIIGINRLHYIHANDSKGTLGDHKDRHAHIGAGQIGAAGFKAILRHPKLQSIPIVIETPHDGMHLKDLRKLITYRPSV